MTADTTIASAAVHTPRDSRRRPVRMGAFVAERFLPVPQLVLLTLLFLAGVTLPAIALDQVSLGGLLGFVPHIRVGHLLVAYVATMLWFFHLRVMDDVKDAPHDRVHETARPIPRGVVGEREADAIAVAVVAVEGVLFWWVGPWAFAGWLLATAFSVLMRVEFFVGDWLDRRVLAYAVSHMLSMGLVYAMLVGIGLDLYDMPGAPRLAEASHLHVLVHDVWSGLFGSAELLMAYAGAICLGMGFELGRKWERYVAAHGRAAYGLWLVFPVVGTALFAVVAAQYYPAWVTASLCGIELAALFAAARVVFDRVGRAAPVGDAIPKGHRTAIELTPALTGLCVYLVLAAAGVMAVNW